MKIDSESFRVGPDKKVNLSKWPTIVDPYYDSKEQYKDLLQQHMEKLSSLQDLHYASNRHALLLIFQGMDGAGKDGAIRHVMSGVNLEGCEVFSFKQPSAEELEHDFLWRATCRLPAHAFDDYLARLIRKIRGAELDFWALMQRTIRATPRTAAARNRGSGVGATRGSAHDDTEKVPESLDYLPASLIALLPGPGTAHRST
jgi:hypothetical protein